MNGLENLNADIAQDLIVLVNSLKKLPKTCEVKYGAKTKDGKYITKEFHYVPLDDILEKIKENNNFAFMQPIVYDEATGKVGIECVLIHKSGKTLTSQMFPLKDNVDSKIQDEGAEITYRKRYSAGAFFGIASEEDTDGNDEEASPATERKATISQVTVLESYYKGKTLETLLEKNNIKSLSELSLKKASELIKKISEMKEKKNAN